MTLTLTGLILQRLDSDGARLRPQYFCFSRSQHFDWAILRRMRNDRPRTLHFYFGAFHHAAILQVAGMRLSAVFCGVLRLPFAAFRWAADQVWKLFQSEARLILDPSSATAMIFLLGGEAGCLSFSIR
ncbi:hypothetical protein CKAH01_10894 [Colletotrichum kahawae]|uniref:Uncharacterized protein n=1 Tax=Colletotrichum kahawae TaxID=34407 RepID=A0AAD9XV47_COLKA|nr:hypothetical protein CKAH01_10894 [Colletotrichum kahawae]